MRIVEVTSKSFLDKIAFYRRQNEYGQKLINFGFYFAFHNTFRETGIEDFRSKKSNEVVDKEVFVLETIADYEGEQNEVVEYLSRFFCGVKVFEDLSKKKSQKELQQMLFDDISDYVTNEDIQNQIQEINQILL